MGRSEPSYPSGSPAEDGIAGRSIARRDFAWGGVAAMGLLRVHPLCASGAEPKLASVEKIWDRAAYSSFTDLIRYQDRWYCTFREGVSHAGDTGVVRVLVSDNARDWSSAGLLTERAIDLRDPKLSVMPDGRLMLVMGGIVNENGEYLTRSPRVSFSSDGGAWSAPRKVLSEDHWLWRVTWHKGRGYCLSKLNEGSRPRRGFLYSTADGVQWDYITEFMAEGVSETTLRFMPDDEMIALVRPGWIGRSRPPYKEWKFHKLNQQIGGPNFIRLPDGSLWASARRYNSDGTRNTVLARMTRESYEPVLTLPSGGDTSYTGMVWHDEMLWLSYYSSHESKTSIYLAQIRFS